MPLGEHEPRLFSKGQREAHSLEVGGCEWEVAHGQQCGDTHVQGDHIQPYSKGGKTEEDNLLTLCSVHHAGKHLLDEEPYSAKLLESHMNEADKQRLQELRRTLGMLG